MAAGSRSDPRCPECGGPVGATSVYCMHCGAEFPEGAVGGGSGAAAQQSDDSADVTDSDDVSWGGAASASVDRGSSGGFLANLLDPDGTVDNSLTVVVGAGVGVVGGVLVLFTVLFATSHEVSLLAGMVAWIGLTVYLARQRTVFGALRLGCYTLAVLLLVAPVAILSPFLDAGGSGLGERLVFFFVFEGVALIPAVVLLVAGYLAGRGRPDDGTDDDTDDGTDGTGDPMA